MTNLLVPRREEILFFILQLQFMTSHFTVTSQEEAYVRVSQEIEVTHRAFPYKKNTLQKTEKELYLCTSLLLWNRTAFQTAAISRFGNIKHRLVPERVQRRAARMMKD